MREGRGPEDGAPLGGRRVDATLHGVLGAGRREVLTQGDCGVDLLFLKIFLKSKYLVPGLILGGAAGPVLTALDVEPDLA